MEQKGPTSREEDVSMKPNNNNNKKPNYFAMEIKNGGENWLAKKTSDKLQFDAIRVFRDLARRNVNVQTDGQWFLNPQFLECCINSAYTKLFYYRTCFAGVTELINKGQTDASTAAVANSLKRSVEAYNIIYVGLNDIRMTGDPNVLEVMMGNLWNYRSNI